MLKELQRKVQKQAEELDVLYRKLFSLNIAYERESNMLKLQIKNLSKAQANDKRAVRELMRKELHKPVDL